MFSQSNIFIVVFSFFLYLSFFKFFLSESYFCVVSFTSLYRAVYRGQGRAMDPFCCTHFATILNINFLLEKVVSASFACCVLLYFCGITKLLLKTYFQIILNLKN